MQRAAVAGVLAAFFVVVLLQPLPTSLGSPFVWAVKSATVLVACTAMLRRARTAPRGLRRPRRLLASSLMVGGLSGLVAIAWLLVTGERPPEASLVDVVHFGYLPLVVAGLLCYPVTDTKAGSVSRAVLDGTVAAGALWFVAWALLLGPASVGSGLPLLTQVTTLAYPAADVFVLGMLSSVLPRVAARARRELLLTGGGLALYAVSDFARTVLSAAGTYRSDSWVAAVAELGLLLILLGARSPEGTSRAEQAIRRWLVVLPQLPVAAALGLAGAIALRGDGLDGPLLLAAIVLVGALFLRQAVAARDRDDLTARLAAREELFRSLVTGASDLITLHDRDGAVSYASPAVERMLGLTEAQLLGRSISEFVDPEDRLALRETFARVVAERDACAECRVRLRDTSGQWRWTQVLLKNQLHRPSVRGVVINARDVHEGHLLEKQLQRAAFSDALTGLGNLAQARALLQECYEVPRPATVVLVDLDGFKAVNDTFGHAHGDALLCQVADRLRRCLRAEDHVTRIGGDEFVLVLDDSSDAHTVAARVLDALRAPVPVAGASLSVRASLGVALTSQAATPDEVLRNADLAMYASKAAGRDRCTWYEAWMHDTASRRMALHRGLRDALDQDRLALHYQPIVRLPDGAVVGAEALLRWDDPVEGAIPPDVFIPVAEESGIIGELDVWVLDRACRDVAAWRAAGVDVPRVSINVSRRHMTPELPGLVEQALRRHGLRGEDLCLEVTESAVVPDAEVASTALTQVRALGVHVALDDFGSGESSLSQLARLPVDSVKIDRSFTQSAGSDPVALRLLTSIVGVCQALSLPVVAEGVEQAELAGFLAGIGCDRAQGYHFGRPQPALQFRRLLRAPAPPVPSQRVVGQRTPL